MRLLILDSNGKAFRTPINVSVGPSSNGEVAALNSVGQYDRSLIPLMDLPGGRLTLSAGTPVTTSNVTAAGTLYYAPYLHDRLPVRQNGQWLSVEFTELSRALEASTYRANTVHDVFADATGASLSLSTTAWSSATARATALTRLDGIWVDAQERTYLGTIATTSIAGQTEDSETNRLVWNAYNRRPRVLKRYETVGSWTCNVLWRPWNNNPANRVTIVCGLAEEPIDLLFTGRVDGAAGVYGYLALAVDATTSYTGMRVVLGNATLVNTLSVRMTRILGMGRHFVQAVEAATGGTVTTPVR